MITELKHQLTLDQRRTLLFLTGNQRIVSSSDCTKEDLWNIHEFFGWNKPNSPKILKLIIKRDETITKVVCK